MTVPEHLRKWLPYAAVLLTLFTLETLVLPHLSPWLPCLLPLMVGMVGVLEGPTAGAAFGLGTGLLFSFQTPGAEGLFLFPLALMGALTGLMTQKWGLSRFPACLLGGLSALIFLDFLRILYFSLLRGEGLFPLVAVAGAEILISALCLPLVYALCSLAVGRRSR